MKKGDIYYLNIGEYKGSEQGGNRPVIILKENKEKVLVATMTTKPKKKLKVHVVLDINDTGLKESSLILLEQLKTVEKKIFETYQPIGQLKNEKKWVEINNGLKISLGL